MKVIRKSKIKNQEEKIMSPKMMKENKNDSVRLVLKKKFQVEKNTSKKKEEKVELKSSCNHIFN